MESRNSVDVDNLKNFNANDITSRRTLPCYEFCRQIEDLFLNIPMKNDIVETKFILPGFVYG